MATTMVAPLIVITGPTASGKTSLAIELAKRYSGEIICADSRTVYRGMDIGTAKPTTEERRGVPHWGLDLVEPDQSFSVAQFKDYAVQKIAEIRAHGKVPFLVGGTGLYIDAVIFDFQFGTKADESMRQRLSRMSVEQLQDYCVKNNVNLPENRRNKRYLMRAIERCNHDNTRNSTPDKQTIVVGIATKKELLRTRIELRAEQLFSGGVVKEATMLGEIYGWESEAMTGNIYPLVRHYLRGEIDDDELVRQFIISDWRLAKRQLTWLRRNPFIMWADLASAEHYLSGLLAE
ncbi:MAG: tRNA (adenosine(37)-N6)-dimethylallyltransferase MiaA [Candidatus Saccharibacteria bacterium]|nr:tRNA (adenosine(37)-N6)-dimethylallyltransferase MiaA [Candidatus Saccharibacteria bacterium]